MKKAPSDNGTTPLQKKLGQVPTKNKALSYDAVRFNATKHGILSRYTVLSHESHADYQGLLTALMDEHEPVGATERHLVEELASVIWRKRRVLQAEGSIINRGLKSYALDAHALVPVAAPFEFGLSGDEADIRDLVGLDPEEVAERQRYALLELEASLKAQEILWRGGVDAYDKALRVLTPDSLECWGDHLAENDCQASAEGLAAYIRETLEPVSRRLEKEARHTEAIKNQALGEGLDSRRLEPLSRYETHLDRKFERTLGMLIRLQEIRASSAE